MHKAATALLLSAAMSLGGCATLFGPRLGSELVGRSARLEPARGQASTLFFASDGTVRATFGTRNTSGRWFVEKRRLCFLWVGNFRECWPYARRFRPGLPQELRSDRGNVVRVTLL